MCICTTNPIKRVYVDVPFVLTLKFWNNFNSMCVPMGQNESCFGDARTLGRKLTIITQIRHGQFNDEVTVFIRNRHFTDQVLLGFKICILTHVSEFLLFLVCVRSLGLYSENKKRRRTPCALLCGLKRTVFTEKSLQCALT